jgi:tetratricopeptide (TPR) repeat protein
VACYHEALRLDPKLALAHHNLGLALAAQGDLKGAVACYREALRLDPNYAPAHNNLGNALKAQGDLKGAVACYHEALRLDPKDAGAHVNLGLTWQQQGRFAEALAALRRGHDLLKPTDPYLPTLRQSIRQCQLLLEYDGLLPAVLRGEASPATAADGLWLAWLCRQSYRQRYAASAHLYREAFAAQPQLATDLQRQHRYDAACAAALAGCGKGNDAPKDEAGRARLRQQALAWLRADLSAYDKLAAGNKAAVRQRLRHWQQDADLAGVRDQDALAKLPAEERTAWAKLWADVDALLRRAAP